jgi:hypothetical protein
MALRSVILRFAFVITAGVFFSFFFCFFLFLAASIFLGPPFSLVLSCRLDSSLQNGLMAKTFMVFILFLWFVFKASMYDFTS